MCFFVCFFLIGFYFVTLLLRSDDLHFSKRTMIPRIQSECHFSGGNTLANQSWCEIGPINIDIICVLQHLHRLDIIHLIELWSCFRKAGTWLNLMQEKESQLTRLIYIIEIRFFSKFASIKSIFCPNFEGFLLKNSQLFQIVM